MTIECDVLVVGGGPAGIVASLSLAKKNIDAILLEKRAEVGAHTNTKIDITPQEGLEEIIKDLSLKHSGHGKRSTWYAPNGKKFVMESEIGEYYFKRGNEPDSFENHTLKLAQDNGCNLICNSEVTDIKNKNDIINVKLKNGDQINSKYLIGSDGKNSIAVKKCFESKKGRELIGYGISGYDFDINHGTSEIFFDVNLIPGGYIYLAKDDSNLSSAGIVLDPCKISYSPEKYLNEFMKKNQNFKKKIEGKNISKFEGSGYIGAIENLRSGNILLAGAAGRLASPFFGYGMRSAIISGYLAANASIDAVNGNIEKIDTYNEECKEKLNLDLLTKLGKNWEKLENEDLNIFFEVLKKIDEWGGKIGFLEKIKILNMLRKSKKSKQLRFILTSFEEMA